MKHQHRFVAVPFTGKNAWNGKEALFGFHIQCEQCFKEAKDGDHIVEIKASHWKEIIPKPQTVDIIYQSKK